MATRRMFSIMLVNSDDFMDLNNNAKCLYFYLCLSADDDGFVNNYRSTMRLLNVTAEDLESLIKARYIIRFDSGVLVVRHWLVNNQLRADRYRATDFIFEKDNLIINAGMPYEFKSVIADENETTISKMATNGIPMVYTGKDRTVEDRGAQGKGKDNKGKDKKGEVTQGEGCRGETKKATTVQIPQEWLQEEYDYTEITDNTKQDIETAFNAYSVIIKGDVFPNNQKIITAIVSKYGVALFMKVLKFMKEQYLDYSFVNMESICSAVINKKESAVITKKLSNVTVKTAAMGIS